MPHASPGADLDSRLNKNRFSYMKFAKLGTVASIVMAAPLLLGVSLASALGRADLVRDILRQQSGAERASCTAVQRTLAAGADASLVVRTAIEIGYNSCQTIRCALKEKTEYGKDVLCDKVIRGAAAAGAQADVISRCSEEVCEPAAVAAILSDVFLDLNYCYFAFRPSTQADPLPPSLPVIDRSLPTSQASPFTFPTGP